MEKFTETLSNIYDMLSKGRTTHSIKGMVFKVMKIGKIDRKSERAGPHPGLRLVQTWSKLGPKLIQKLVQIWSKVGPKLVQSWSKVGPKLVQSWSKIGPKLV